jgi:hypothetical protein
MIMPNNGDEQFIINAKSVTEKTGIEPAENMEKFLTEVQKELNEKFLTEPHTLPSPSAGERKEGK